MQIKPTGFRVARWAAWTPEFDNSETAGVPPSLKRRVGKTGQKALSAAWKLDAKNARIIFSSRHGDFSRSLSLIDSLAKTGEVSPADFTLSVHHGLVGLLSIAQINRRGHTAISAGTESFCYGLLEAVACLKENPDEQVMLIHCDEVLPAPFAQFNEPGEQNIALALLLDNGNEFSLSAHKTENKKSISSAPAQDFLQLLRSDIKEKTSICETAEWHWMKNALTA